MSRRSTWMILWRNYEYKSKDGRALSVNVSFYGENRQLRKSIRQRKIDGASEKIILTSNIVKTVQEKATVKELEF